MPKYHLFLDETGNHSQQIGAEDSDDPQSLFLLCGCLLRATALPALEASLAALKSRYPCAPGTVLVSRQIRRRLPPLEFLNDPELRAEFLADVTAWVSGAPCIVYAAAIDRARHKQQYGEYAGSPYDLSLEFILERVAMTPLTPGRTVRVTAESRGRREDAALRAEFQRLLDEGGRYLEAARFRSRFLPPLVTVQKLAAVAGLQLADLVAYPLAQRLRNPQANNPAFDVVRPKLHRSRKGIWGAGLKVFPPTEPGVYGL